MRQFAYNLKEEFHKHRNVVFVVFVFCMTAVWSFFSTSNMHNSSAANLSNFNPGNIISDAVMSNYSAMSVTEIQAFLDSKNSCDNRNYDLYLQYKAAHPTITWHWEGEPYNGHFVCLAQEKFGDGEVIGSGMTAAEIIADAAKQYKINPQVLLVLLQKESSLITDKVPNSYDYQKATGYGCPDTAACNSKYYGFKNQIYRAAELFRYVLDHNSAYYPANTTNPIYVGYHPSSSCGGTKIHIENRATAALYQYTPYQPNNAALNAGYGVGDNCSAYGNRNFYLYFTDWFGSTQAAVDGELVVLPDGEYNLVSAVNSTRSLGLSSTNAQLAALDTEDNTQRWKLQRDAGTGYYQITNLQTGNPLIAQATEISSGTNAIVGPSTTCSKWWKIYQTGDGYLTLESTCTTGMVLDVNGGSGNVNTNIQLWLTHGGASQKWQLSYTRTIQDGLYAIQSSVNTAMVLDVNGGGTADGTNVQLWSEHLQGSQRWYVQYQSNGGYYTITNPQSQKRLDLSGAIAADGRNLQIWVADSSCAQKWYILPNGNSYNILSACSAGYSMDIKNNQAIEGQNVQLSKFSNTDSQKWQFRELSLSLAEGTYIIQPSASTTKALDIYGGYKTEGTNIELYDYHGSEWQQWQVQYNSQTDDYKFYNAYTGKYLDLYGSFTRPGENIQTWVGNSGCGQRWRVQSNGDNTYSVQTSCASNRSLDLYGGFLQNRTNIQLWESHNGASQKWYFTPVK